MFLELTVAVCLIVGLAVIFSNPSRVVNRVFAGVSLLLLLWLGSITMSVEFPRATYLSLDFFWNRANAVLASGFPVVLWLLKECIIYREKPFSAILLRSTPWVIYLFGGVLFPIIHDFIFIDDTTGRQARGIIYILDNIYLEIGYAIVLLSSHLARNK